MAVIIYKFMENTEWYFFDEKEKIYKLTDKAPEEAKTSYEGYIKEIKK